MVPIGDPNPRGIFQDPPLLGNSREREKTAGKRFICMGLYYEVGRWNGTPTLDFFLPYGGGSDFSADLHTEIVPCSGCASSEEESNKVRFKLLGRGFCFSGDVMGDIIPLNGLE